MLKMTKIKLEVITGPEMYIFFDEGTRGTFYICNRYSKGNNKGFLMSNTFSVCTIWEYFEAWNLWDHFDIVQKSLWAVQFFFFSDFGRNVQKHILYIKSNTLY